MQCEREEPDAEKYPFGYLKIKQKKMNHPDTAAAISSCLEDSTLSNVENPLFWKARVEILLKKNLPSSLVSNWRRVYCTLKKSSDLSLLGDCLEDEEAVTVLCYSGVTPRVEDIAQAITRDLHLVLQIILQQDSASVNDPYFSQVEETPLILACRLNKVKSVELLLADKRLDPNIPDYVSPLYTACCVNSSEIVTLLLKDERLDVARAGRGCTSCCISEKDDTTVLSLLLADERVVALDHTQAFVRAVSYSAVKCLELLLQDKSIPVPFNIFSSFLRANKSPRRAEILHLLLEDGRVAPIPALLYLIMQQDDSYILVKMLLEDGRIDPTLDNLFCLTIARDIGDDILVEILSADPRVKEALQ